MNRLWVWVWMLVALALACLVGCATVDDETYAMRAMGQAISDYKADADRHVEKLRRLLRESEWAYASAVMMYELKASANTQGNVPIEVFQTLESQREAAWAANEVALTQLEREWEGLQVNYANAMRLWEALAQQWDVVGTFIQEWAHVRSD